VAHVWEILGDSERIRWDCLPLVGVGPVRFDMTCEQVTEAVAETFPRIDRRGISGYRNERTRATFSPPGDRFGGAITTYYDHQGLACIAAHARLGPQVSLFGLSLVGRVPSEIEHEFGSGAQEHGYNLQYGTQADLGSPDLGIVLRTERAGDYARSRPVFVADRWTEMCADESESCIPTEEWTTFLS
jgi:hypothetical protein